MYPPPRKTVVARFLRALKRQNHRSTAEAQKRRPDHGKNERMMALWTKRVGQFTIVLAIVTAVSACISFYMWREMVSSSEDTKKLIKAAQDSAKAAQDALRIAKDTAKRQLRAYLLIKRPELTMEGNRLKLFFVIKNAGQTPAYNAELELYFRAHEVSNVRSIYMIPTYTPEMPKLFIGPDADIKLTSYIETTITREEMQTFLAQKGNRIIITSEITYRDIFMETHRIRNQMRGNLKGDGTLEVWAGPGASESD